VDSHHPGNAQEQEIAGWIVELEREADHASHDHRAFRFEIDARRAEIPRDRFASVIQGEWNRGRNALVTPFLQ